MLDTIDVLPLPLIRMLDTIDLWISFSVVTGPHMLDTIHFWISFSVVTGHTLFTSLHGASHCLFCVAPPEHFGIFSRRKHQQT